MKIIFICFAPEILVSFHEQMFHADIWMHGAWSPFPVFKQEDEQNEDRTIRNVSVD